MHFNLQEISRTVDLLNSQAELEPPKAFCLVNRSTLREINPSPFYHLHVDFPIGNRVSVRLPFTGAYALGSEVGRQHQDTLPAPDGGALGWGGSLSLRPWGFFRTNGERMCVNRTRELT